MPPPSWRLMSAELRARGLGDLRRDLVRAVRVQGEPTVAAVRAAWMSIEVTSSRGGTARPDRSTNLRARVAAATRVQVTATGIRIVVAANRVDPRYGRSLPWYLNASGRPWRHPVFGRTENPQDWQQQQGSEVFFRTVNERAPQFRQAIAREMERTARDF